MMHKATNTCFVVACFCSALHAAAPTTQPAPQIVGGPYLQAPSPTSMTIVWTTSAKCVSKVQYGTSADKLDSTAQSAHYGLIDANITLHRITINGLQPATTYYYRVLSTEIVEFRSYKVTLGQTVSRDGQFTTLAPDKDKFSFITINDRHDKAAELRKALHAVKWEGVDLVFGVGDVMNDPKTEPQIIDNFINPCVESFASGIPLVFVRGNHEARGTLARDLMNYFPSPTGQYYYSFDHGNVHFLLLDGGEDKGDVNPEYSGLIAFEDYIKQETEWLQEELQTPAFRNARFRVCLMHVPPAPEGHNDAKFMRAPWIRDNWIPVLSKAGVDLMISGHTHKYAELPPSSTRSFPIVVGDTDTVIRVDVSPERLQLTTHKDDGTVLSHPPEIQRKHQ